MSDVSTELDELIPRHQLLDNTAAKHKTDLIHRGTLATRHKPTGEALKTQILKKQNLNSKDNSPAPDLSLEKLIPKPDKKAKDAKVSLMADLQKLHKKKIKDPPKTEIENLDKANNNVTDNDDDENKNNMFLTQLKNIKNTTKPRIKSSRGDQDSPGVPDQLRLKLEARKKLVDESNEVSED